MKKFLLRTFLFLLPLALLLMGGEAVLRLHPNAAKAKDKAMRLTGSIIDTLILGSSHAYYGLCPELLGRNAYNAAQVSQTLKYDEFILNRYALPRLRAVVLTVSDFSFYEELEGTPSWYLAGRYRMYMGCDYHSLASAYAWEAAAFPVFAKKLLALCQPPRERWSLRGQGLEYTLENRAADWDNGSTRAAVNRYEDFSHGAVNEARLCRMAALCRKRGISLVLVATPLRPSYRAEQNPAQTADMHRRIERVAARFPQCRVRIVGRPGVASRKDLVRPLVFRKRKRGCRSGRRPCFRRLSQGHPHSLKAYMSGPGYLAHAGSLFP